MRWSIFRSSVMTRFLNRSWSTVRKEVRTEVSHWRCRSLGLSSGIAVCTVQSLPRRIKEDQDHSSFIKNSLVHLLVSPRARFPPARTWNQSTYWFLLLRLGQTDKSYE